MRTYVVAKDLTNLTINYKNIFFILTSTYNATIKRKVKY